MIVLNVESIFFGVSPAMLKIIAVVTVVSLAVGVIQRIRHEVNT